MSTDSEKQQQHTIPEFLLKQWQGVDGKVQCFGVVAGRFIASRQFVASIASHENLISVEELGRERHFVENLIYSPIDNNAALVHQKLLQTIPSPLSEEDCKVWAQFILSLILRYPDSVAEAKRDFAAGLLENLAMEDTLIRSDFRNARGPSLQEWAKTYRPGWIESFPIKGPAELALDLQRIKAICEASWQLIDAPDKNDFAISTRPICGQLISGNFPEGQWVKKIV